MALIIDERWRSRTFFAKETYFKAEKGAPSKPQLKEEFPSLEIDVLYERPLTPKGLVIPHETFFFDSEDEATMFKLKYSHLFT